MNIGDVTKGGLDPSKHLQNRTVEQTQSIDARVSPRNELQEERSEHQDSVAISEEGRKALEEDQNRLQDLGHAREALDQLPSISKDRDREIRERMKSHYYTQPEILQQIASRIGSDLTNRGESR